MAELCRLCAAVRKTEMLSPITVDICEKLKECFAIEICDSADDGLPKCACTSCFAKLQTAHVFYKTIKESQESLNLLYNRPKDKSDDNSSGECENNTEKADTGDDAFKEIIDMHNLEETTYIKCETDKEPMQLRVDSKAKEGCDEDEENMVLYEVVLSDADECVELEDVIEGVIEYATNFKNDEIEGNAEIEIETYMLEEEEEKDEDEDEKEKMSQETEDCIGRNAAKEGEDTDTDVNNEHKSKEMQIEILSVNSDADVDLQSHQTPTVDKNIQILEWKSYTWICHICSKPCISFPTLLAHAKEAHNVANMTSLRYECTDCQKMCSTYNKFQNHIRFRHHTDLKLRCDACDLQQDNYEQLAKHREMCSEAAVLYPLVDICKICGKHFPNYNATSKHADVLHRKDDTKESHVTSKGYQCSHCEKSFKQVANLRAHERIHSNFQKYTCEVCDRTFHQRNALKLHFYTHIDDKVYECKICKKNFKTTSSLEKHHQIHKDIKKFSCDYCKKDFRTKDEKTSHERIHTGEKPFACTYCDRSFRFRSGLMCHINTHTGESPYSCSDCGRGFTNWGNMNKHSGRCSKRKSVAKD